LQHRVLMYYKIWCQRRVEVGSCCHAAQRRALSRLLRLTFVSWSLLLPVSVDALPQDEVMLLCLYTQPPPEYSVWVSARVTEGVPINNPLCVCVCACVRVCVLLIIMLSLS